MSSILSALGDPIRLQILKKLASGDELTCSCCDVNLQKSALSHHFKVLREAGLINVRIEGTQRFLSIRYEDLDARFPGLIGSVLKNA
jgi:DNA-binding transcriptional ArsR family regulator